MRLSGAMAGSFLAVLAAAAMITSCGSTESPAICTDLERASDITGIAQAISNVAPGYDYAANELKAEPVVAENCPEQSFKLERYREQVINPVTGGR